MSTKVKIEFQVVSGQIRYFRLKSSPPGQYRSNHVGQVKNEFSGQNRHFRSKPSPPSQYGSNHVDQDKKWVSGRFRVKTVISGQNRVHRVNTGQTMSTRIKNEFHAVLGQTCYFFGQNPVHRVYIHWKFFFMFQHNFR